METEQNYGYNNYGYNQSLSPENNTDLGVPEKKKKQKKEKQKLPFNILFKRILIGILLTIILIPTITYFVLLFGFKINVFSVVKQVKTLNKKVYVDALYVNRFSTSDYDSFNLKYSSTIVDDVLLFSDKEVAAFINHELNNNSENINSNSALINNYSLSLIQIDFYDTFDINSPNHYTNMNVVFSLDLAKIKQEYFSKFPANLFGKYIPETAYISADFEILKTSEANNPYQIQPISLKLNNLSVEATKSFLQTLKTLAKFYNADELCSIIGNAFTNILIGTESNKGLYYDFTDIGIEDYSFYSEGLNDYFIMYEHSSTETKTITYENTKDAENKNISTYSVLYNKIPLKEISSNGYNFLGWYDKEDLNSASKIEIINAWELKNVKLYAHWSLVEYTIEYVMRSSSVDGELPTTYTIEDELNLLVPKKQVIAEFKGWSFKYTDSRNAVPGYDDPDLSLKIKKGTFGDLTLYARFDDERNLEIFVDGVRQTDITIVLGEYLEAEQINTDFHPESVGMSGYTVKQWFFDKELKNPLTSNHLITEDMTVYGQWSYIVNVLSFYPYLDKFNSGISSNAVIDINSHQELQAYCEYAIFYDIDKAIPLNIKYLNKLSGIKQEINTIVNKISKNNSFACGFEYQYSITIQGYLSLTLNTNAETFATKVMDKDKKYTYTQSDFALKNQFTPTRAEDYDDFKINNVSKTLKVSNSFQLAYCIEQGYRPDCQVGSSAEQLYNKAKTILRDICDDSMTDVEKLRAIYEWLILNVNYDHKSADSIKLATEAHKYNAWFIEGVLNDGVAVCEGYAKTLLLLAKIEGIPTIFVTGNGHAWNKVYINGTWYGIDATHGDLSTANKTEVFSYKEFLFSDNYKSKAGYPTSDYLEFKAQTNYDTFNELEYEYKGETHDLLMENTDEIINLVSYIREYAKTNNLKSYTFQFEVNSSLTYNVVTQTINIKLLKNASYIYESNGKGGYIYLVLV